MRGAEASVTLTASFEEVIADHAAIECRAHPRRDSRVPFGTIKERIPEQRNGRAVEDHPSQHVARDRAQRVAIGRRKILPPRPQPGAQMIAEGAPTQIVVSDWNLRRPSKCAKQVKVQSLLPSSGTGFFARHY